MGRVVQERFNHPDVQVQRALGNLGHTEHWRNSPKGCIARPGG